MSFVSKVWYIEIFINFLYRHCHEKQVDKTRKWAANTFFDVYRPLNKECNIVLLSQAQLLKISVHLCIISFALTIAFRLVLFSSPGNSFNSE